MVAFKIASILLALGPLVLIVKGRDLGQEGQENETVKVSKCCEVNSLLVEENLGHRTCKKRKELLHIDLQLGRTKWEPAFFQDGLEVIGPRSIVLQMGMPKCDFEAGDQLFAVSHSRKNDDELRLLTNGTMSHRLVHTDHINITSQRVFYGPDKYCMDDIIVTHNYTDAKDDELILDFAYLCINNRPDIKALMNHYIYPVGLSVSMMCFILTFLLYSFLPQLRDLTGKFILGICSFMSIAFAAMLVDLFGWKDPNVEKLTTETVLHGSIVGVWFCLNAMGHHAWKIIKSKSVFTRVTDGQRLRYYSLYIILCTGLVITTALCVHFFIEDSGIQGEKTNFLLGWNALAAFYSPVAITLLANIYFYFSSQKRISTQLVYNRSMQHFQVNFDLFTKFFIVIAIWWLMFTLSLLQMAPFKYIGMVFNLIQGPLIFCVAMCRTRVAFLFKKYFCEDVCCFKCKSDEFIDEECQELSTIDRLKNKENQEEIREFLQPFLNINASSNDKEMSKSLYNVRNREPGEIPPPVNPEMPVGRIKRLLKSNSLTALTNINFGWRKETAV